MLETRALILAKIETTYGTDPTPAAATDCIVTTKPTIELLGDRQNRDVVLPYYGALGPVNIGTGIKLSFSTELKGSGAAGTAPKIGTLLRACNMTQTLTPSTKADYDPNSSENGESVTLYFYKDGKLHHAHGCVGTWKIGCKANNIVMIDFEFTGLYAGDHASEVAFPTPTYGDTVAPCIFKSAQFQIHGYAAIIENFNISLEAEIKKRTDANTATGVYRYYIGDRKVKGDCDPEVVALATWNPWTLWDASTPGALTCTVGQSAGNKCIITAPAIVPETPKYGEREGLGTYAYSFTSHVTLTGGNNEVKLSFQ